ncbi:MAG: hypothetical protein ACRD2H_12030 [Terriglobales bacterium]
MTAINVTFRYGGELAAASMRRLADVLAIYGLRKLRVDEAATAITVEYDATRMDNDMVAAILRNCGLQIGEQVEISILA